MENIILREGSAGSLGREIDICENLKVNTAWMKVIAAVRATDGRMSSILKLSKVNANEAIEILEGLTDQGYIQSDNGGKYTMMKSPPRNNDLNRETISKISSEIHSDFLNSKTYGFYSAVVPTTPQLMAKLQKKVQNAIEEIIDEAEIDIQKCNSIFSISFQVASAELNSEAQNV